MWYLRLSCLVIHSFGFATIIILWKWALSLLWFLALTHHNLPKIIQPTLHSLHPPQTTCDRHLKWRHGKKTFSFTLVLFSKCLPYCSLSMISVRSVCSDKHYLNSLFFSRVSVSASAAVAVSVSVAVCLFLCMCMCVSLSLSPSLPLSDSLSDLPSLATWWPLTLISPLFSVVVGGC